MNLRYSLSWLLNLFIFLIFLIPLPFSNLWAQSWQKFQEAQYLEKIRGDFASALTLYEELLQQPQENPPLSCLVRYRRAYILYEIRGFFEEARLEYESISKAAFEPSAGLANERLQFLRLAHQQAQQKTIEQLTQNIALLNTQLDLQKDPEIHTSESTKTLVVNASEKNQPSQQETIHQLLKTVQELEAKLKNQNEKKTESKTISEPSWAEKKQQFTQQKNAFLLALESHDYPGAQHLLDSMEKNLISNHPAEKIETQFVEESKILLGEFHRKLQEELEKSTRRLASFQKAENFRKRDYKEYAALVELLTGEAYSERQMGENGFPELQYQIPEVPKILGPEKLIQLIKKETPLPVGSFDSSLASIQFQNGSLSISQQPQIHQMILSFLNSLGNPRFLKLKLSCVVYGPGELDPFLANLPGSKITVLKNCGYATQFTSAETQNFERFLLRSGFPRFISKTFPLQHLRESFLTLQYQYPVITGYLPVQTIFREITESISYGLSLRLIPLCHRSGNLTFSMEVQNQLLAFPVAQYLTEQGRIHLPLQQSQSLRQSCFFFEEGQSVMVFGLKNPFPEISPPKEHLLLHFQIFRDTASRDTVPKKEGVLLQSYDLSDLLEIPDYPAPRLKYQFESGLPPRSSFLQEYFQQATQPLPLDILVNGTRLEVRGAKEYYRDIENLLAQIRADTAKLLYLQVRAFIGKKDTFPMSTSKKMKGDLSFLIRNNGPQTLLMLSQWGKPLPLSNNTIWASNTQLVHLHHIEETSFVPQFYTSKEEVLYPKIEPLQEGLTCEFRPVFTSKNRVLLHLKMVGIFLSQIQELEQKTPLGEVSISIPEIDLLEGSGAFDLKEEETLVLMKPFKNRQLVLWISPHIHELPARSASKKED